MDRDMANPFGRSVTGYYFVGREAELSRFQTNLAGLRNCQPNHEYVAGLEGAGKTYYLHKLSEIARKEGFVSAVTNLDYNVTPHIQVRTILEGIIDALQNQWRSDRPLEQPRNELLSDWGAGSQSKLFRHHRQDVLITSDLKQDLLTISRHTANYGYHGIVMCIDEGQRVEAAALSGLKNALEDIGNIQLVLSWRLKSDAGGAIEAGRREIRDRATAAEQDQGAARLFGTATAMGPFATSEVHGFFSRRLSGKPIQFSETVCGALGEIADRIPGRIIDLAGKVYDRALREQLAIVETAVLDDCFQERYPEELKQAVDLWADLPRDMRDIVKALCTFLEPATALELVDYAFPNLENPIREGYAEGKSARLEQVCKKTSIIIQNRDKFVVASSVHRYALKMTMR